MFEFLDHAHPLIWVAVALLLGTLFLATAIELLLWPACAALAVGLLLYAFPELAGAHQLLLFVLLSVCSVFVARYLLPHRTDGSASLNAPGNRMIGRQAKVVEANGFEGQVTIDSVHWHAKWREGRAVEGESVTVVGHEGTTLIVRAQPRQ
ncbi:MAG: NfeD family protein [Rhodobacteraceae bacterium]|nr:NfeD family protein [Paracoccaceae bacterium]